MHRFRTWTRGYVEVLRAWQRYAARRCPHWPRLTTIYTHLKALPSTQQTQWRRRCKATLWGVALMLALQPAGSWAANFNAGTAVELITAIDTANSTVAADTITLTADITLTTANNSTYEPTGLPVISSAIMIEGNRHTITRDPRDPDRFRLTAINSNGNLTLQDTTLSGGNAFGSGGALLNFSGQLRLEGCTVSGNYARTDGGGIFSTTASSGAVSIMNSRISGNWAPGHKELYYYCSDYECYTRYRYIGGSGGGIFSTSDSSTLSVGNSTVSGNTAYAGGGIYSLTNGSDAVSIINSMVSGNTAYAGGGVLSVTFDSSTLSVVNGTVSGNLAYAGGGVLSVTFDSSTLSLVNSTVSGNSAGLSGGGVFSVTSDSSTLSVVNGTVSGNLAYFGGGVLSFAYGSSRVNLVNSTLSGNSAAYGGGVYSLAYSENMVVLHRSLIAGNSAASGGDEVASRSYGGSFLADDHNLFGHSGVSTSDALYGFTAGATDILATSDSGNATALAAILHRTLADNGGPTQTHTLVTGSSAIDAAGSCGLTEDQRGAPRPFDGDGDTEAACDIGAVEFGAPVPSPCDGATPTLGCKVNGVLNQPCVGGPGKDVIFGTSGDDVIVGGGGNDTLKGNAGNDLLCGEAGNDRLFGGSGDDDLVGGDDIDLLRGDGGTDRCYGETAITCEL